MPDDLDNLVRAAMKTLDDQVPSGYFEALPNRTLARLEGKDMQSTTGTTSERDPNLAAPPPVAPAQERKEDSGLHDIRSLAQSTKQRLSNKRTTASPVKTDDELLAASSMSLKAVALPEPARMVSLPSLDELPSKKEVLAKERAASASELPVADQRQPFAHITARRKSKAPIAIAGVLLAAAAGVAVYITTQQKSDSTGSQAVAKNEKADTAAMGQAAPVAPAPPAAQPAANAQLAAADEPKAAETPPPAEADKDVAAPAPAPEVVAKVETKPAPGGKHVASPKKGKAEAKSAKEAPAQTEATPPPPADKKPEDKKVDGKKTGGKDGEEPSFDALLKEAGVDQQKKTAKPALEKKSLSRDDFKKGMSAVSGKAQGCYKGTQGTVQFNMAVAPSGQVTSVTITGAFAGKPEGACVEAAVRSASFPAWDGGPQTFTYSYLLAE